MSARLPRSSTVCLTLILLLAVLFTSLTPSSTAAPPVARKNNFFPLIQNGDGFTEVVAARNATSRVFFGVVNGKPIARIQKFPVPIHFFDARTRQWLPIDTRIVRDNATGTYRNAAAGFDAHFASATTAPWSNPAALLQVSRPAQPALRLRLESARPSAPVVAGDTITYTAVAARTDLVYQVRSWGIKEDIVLRGRDAPATFTTLLDAPGTQLQRQPDGSWLIRDGAGAALWRIPAPRGADAKGVAAPARLTIASVAGGYRLTTAIDPAWLAAPGRAFPVRIDPSLADPQYYAGETYVQSAFPDIAAWKQRNRFIGNSTVTAPAVKGITRIYTPVDLAFLPARVNPAQVTSAELVFTQYYSENSAGFSTSVYPVQQAWDFQTLTWNNQPTVGNAIVSNVAVSPALGAKRWDVTGWVKQVLANSVTNRGLMIRADDETRGGGVFWSSQCDTLCPAADRPYLQVQVVLDNGFDPVLDTWGFPNRNGLPSFEQYARDYGVPVTTQLVTDTATIGVITGTTSLPLPISFTQGGITATLPLTPTIGISATGDPLTSLRIPKPIAYLYQEVIVKALYDDQFTQYYNAALKGGLCAGMAATVADFHSSGGPSTQAYGGTGRVRSIPDARPAQDFIQQYHGRQVSSQVLRWLAAQGRTDAVGLYNRLIARIGTPDWWLNPEIIGIVKGTSCDDIEIGHALLPYKVVPLSGGQARVFVYDSNHPSSSASDSNNPYIAIDLNTNSWSYELAPASATHPAITWIGRSIYTTPLSLFREKPILPTASDQDLLMVEGGHSVAYGQGGLAFGGHSVAYGEGDDGLKTGCYIGDNGPTFVQEISRTMRLTPLTGTGNGQVFPDTLVFPSKQNWTFTGSGTRAGHLGDMMLFGPHALAGFLSAAGDATRDSAHIDAAFQSLTLRTNDANKPVSAYQMHETDGWTRIYAVSNTTLGAGEVLALTVDPALDHFEVVNGAAAPKTMDLGLGQIGGDAISTIVYPRQPIGAHERRIYTPIDWRDLPHSPIRVDIDLNNDGSIDRSEVLGGVVFPAATLISSVPGTPGQVFPIITHTQLAPGQFGWINLDHPLAPGATPTNAMMGDESAIRAWLQSTRNPGLLPGGGLVGIPGTHGSIFAAIGTRTSGEEQLYHVGDTMIVPLYDHIIPRQGSQPLYYHLAGLAVMRIIASTNSGGDDAACLSNPACNKRVMGELLAKIIF